MKRAQPAQSSYWLFFFLLFLTHFLASLSMLPYAARLGIWIAGLLVSFAWIIRQATPEKPLGPARAAKEPEAAPWAWAAVLAFGLVFRSWRFWALPQWPLWDEASILQAALELQGHWTWKFFYTDGQIPPLLVWAAALFLKTTHRPFFSLFLPPFLVSASTLLFGAWACRRFLPAKPAFLAAALLALAYWPVYLQGLAFQAAWLPLWEVGVLFLLARVLRQQGKGGEGTRLFLLGAWTGLGYWTYASWPVVALAVLPLPFLARKGKGRDFGPALPLAAGFCLAFAYFVFAVVQNGGYGTHYWGFSAFHGWIGGSRVLLSALDYVTCLFWGYGSVGTYAPAQGGFLNPLTAAFFWMGILQFARNRSLRPWAPTAGLALVLFLLPGFLSQDLQCLRILQILLPVLGLAALGAWRLLESLPGPRRAIALVLALAVSFAWDGARLQAGLAPLEGPTAQIRKVYGVLEQIARDQGPGIVLTQFKVQTHPEQGLTVHPEENLAGAVFPFNAAGNGELDSRNARWAAILLHPDEISFIEKDFPGSRWWKPDLQGGGDPDLAVGLIPVTGDDGPRLEKWAEADRWLQAGDWAMLGISNDRSYQEALRYWQDPPAFLRQDRFLETCYWERLAEFYYYRSYESHYQWQVEALQEAVTQGYPAPHLNYDLGCLLLRGHRLGEARACFEAALRADPGNEDVKNGMAVLEHLVSEEKSGNGAGNPPQDSKSN